MINFEKDLIDQGNKYIIGVDEAGRGPLAGPVVASAVMLKGYEFSSKINDSKKLSAKQREIAYHEIQQKAYVGIGVICETVIDSINILRATYVAMENAIEDLMLNIPIEIKKEAGFKDGLCILIDGNSFDSKLMYKVKTVVSGDSKAISIACASIIAKVTRDNIIRIYDKILPEYGLAAHKGYGTKRHIDAIRDQGLSFIHRKSFCKNF